MITEEQRLNRHLSIGASDAAPVCGMGAFASQNQTPLGMYLEKTGQIEPEILDSELLYWGNKNEHNVMLAYSEKTDLKIQRVNATLTHEKHPWMTCHPDGRVLALADGSRRGLEAKTTGDHAFRNYEWGKEGTDEVPPHVLLQCLHLLAVTGWDQWDVAVLVGGNRHLIYHVPRDEDAIGTLIEVEGAFWEHVQSRTPPPADFSHKSTSGLLAKMYPGTNGEIIWLGEDLFSVHKQISQAKAEEKEAKARIKMLMPQIREAVGEGSAGVFSDGSGYTRRLVSGGPVAYERADRMDMRFSKNIKT